MNKPWKTYSIVLAMAALFGSGIAACVDAISYADDAPTRPWKLIEVDRVDHGTRILFLGHYRTFEDCSTALDALQQTMPNQGDRVVACKTAESIFGQDMPL